MKKLVAVLVCVLFFVGFSFGGTAKPVILTTEGVVMSFIESTDGSPAQLDVKIGTGKKRWKFVVDSKTLIVAKDRKVTTSKVLRLGVSVTVKYTESKGILTATFIQLN